jgi:hypothetical protein
MFACDRSVDEVFRDYLETYITYKRSGNFDRYSHINKVQMHHRIYGIILNKPCN